MKISISSTVRRHLVVGAAAFSASVLALHASWAQAPAAPQAAGPAIAGVTGAAPTAAADGTIPRASDGHPLLGGLWGGASGALPTGEGGQLFAGRGGTFYGFEEDNGLARMADLNRPLYKPDYWDQIKENDYDGDYLNGLDPRDSCMPEGLPRIGAPSAILQVPEANVIVFRYATGFDGRSETRFIPTDGRPHNQAAVQMETWYGDSVAHWDGDALVIDTIGFTDQSWLHKNGYIHGFDMGVTERIVRKGDQFTWTATVDDPQYFQKPWTMNPIVKNLNKSAAGFLAEDLPCSVDGARADHIVSHTRSG